MPASDSSGRLPDFVIIGAMKSGTTSLFRWLGAQPEINLPSLKEPDFFSRDDRWERGIGWYRGLFAGLPPDSLSGEASTSYTDPVFAEAAAERIKSVIPEAALFFIVRHPIDRIRSHYRHQVQRGREKSSLLDALNAPGNRYLARSKYWTCLVPYVQRFSQSRLLVVRFEDLIGENPSGWNAALHHLGMAPRPAPNTNENSTAEKQGYTKLMLRLWERGWLDRVKALPHPVRQLGKRLLTHDNPRYRARLMRANEPIPRDMMSSVWDDIARLEAWVGRDMWEKGSETGTGLRQKDIEGGS